MPSVDSLDLMYALRAMAWQRARGELMSILQTYHREPDLHAKMKEAIDYITQQVEEDGLC